MDRVDDELEGGEEGGDGRDWEEGCILLVGGCNVVGRVEEGGERALVEVAVGSGVELEDELVVVVL